MMPLKGFNSKVVLKEKKGFKCSIRTGRKTDYQENEDGPIKRGNRPLEVVAGVKQ